ncbi:MAG: hypothetical protein AAGI68_16430 [Planctomycetota bacterium]
MIVILCVVSLLAVIVLPVLTAPRVQGWQPTNSTQLRGIHQGMVVYAQSNKGNYPGIDASGAVVEPTLSGQFAVLLDAGSLPPDYLINPADRHPIEAVDPGSGYAVTTANHSYAGLDLTVPGGRVHAWSETLDTHEVVLGDRNTGADAHSDTRSVWSARSGGWEGMVVWNDNSTSYELTHLVDTGYFVPLSSPGAMAGGRHWNNSDNLFEAAGAHDAWLVHD